MLGVATRGRALAALLWPAPRRRDTLAGAPKGRAVTLSCGGQRALNTRGAGAAAMCMLDGFSTLYGQTAAAYAKAAGQNAQARQLYNASADTYYKANDAAAYDDWVRARNHWDYFYNRVFRPGD